MSSAVPDGGTWKQAVDTQGRTYYYHAVTKQTVWVLPPGAVLAAPKKRRSTTATGAFSSARRVVFQSFCGFHSVGFKPELTASSRGGESRQR
jgi:hypothetical protein